MTSPIKKVIITTTPDFTPGENNLLEIPDIDIQNTGFNLILTNKRLILTQIYKTGENPIDIPVPVIISATSLAADSGEPALSLQIKAPNGSERKFLLIFTGGIPENRISERESLLKEIGILLGTFRYHTQKHHDNTPKSEPKRNEAEYYTRNLRENLGDVHQSKYGNPDRSNMYPPPKRPAPVTRPENRTYERMHPRAGYRKDEPYNPYANQVPHAPEMRFASPPLERQTNNSHNSCSQADDEYRIDTSGFRDYRAKSGYNQRYNHTAAGSGKEADNRPPGIANNTNQFCGYSRPSPHTRQQRQKHSGKSPFSTGLQGGYADTNSLTSTFFSFLTSPGDAYRSVRRNELTDALPVLLVSLIIFALGNTVFLGILASSLDASVYPVLSTLKDAGTIVFVVIEIVIGGIIAAALSGILITLGAYFKGYDGYLENGIKITAYSSVPYALGGLIPMFGIIIAPLLSIFIQVKGVQETYSMDINSAATVVLIPVAVFILVFAMFAIFGGDNFAIFG